MSAENSCISLALAVKVGSLDESACSHCSCKGNDEIRRLLREAGNSEVKFRLPRTYASTVCCKKWCTISCKRLACLSPGGIYDQQTGGIVRANVCTRAASSGDNTTSQAARPLMIFPRFSSCNIGAKDWREIISKAKFATTVQKRSELPKATPGGAVTGRACKKSSAWAGSSEAVMIFHQCNSAVLGSSNLAVSSNSSGEGRGLLSLGCRRR